MGLSAAINNDALTLEGLLAARVDLADADMLVFPERRLSYGTLNAAARRWAEAFIAAAVSPSDHVGR